MDIQATATSITSSESIDQSREVLNEYQTTLKQCFSRIRKGLNNIFKPISVRNVREQALHHGENHYCYQSKEDQLTPKDRIEADISSGIEIYADKYRNNRYYIRTSIFRENIISFNKILQLLKTDSIDIDKLQTVNFFSDGISNTGYTVVYNGVKLFTITNVDEEIFKTKHTKIKDFKVDFHYGFDELYNSLDSIILTNAIDNKNCIEDDLKEAIEAIIENDDTDTSKEIADINKILQLLNSNTISIIKLKTIDVLVPDDDIPDAGYEDVYDNRVETSYNVVYDGNELFSVSELTIRTPGQLGKENYFEVELFDYFNELYSSLNLTQN